MNSPRVLPIPMQPFSVRAILREIETPGTGKTQTRRIIKPCGDMNGVPMYPHYINGKRSGDTSHPDFADLTDENGGTPLYTGSTSICPGDHLWVREGCHNYVAGDVWKPRWLRDTDDSPCTTSSKRPRPGRRADFHMPRVDSRLTLEVTAVKVERLQEISEEDAIAEGIEHIDDPRGTAWRSYETCPDGTPHPHAVAPNLSPVTSYREVWTSIHGAGSWDVNPWVAAIGFRPILANVDAVLKREAA